jgi:hypothetical protein
LALKPNDGETFLKEVDDELRREQINSFFTRYGWWIIGAAVLILAGIGGYLWWSGRQAAAREGTGENLVAAMDQLDRGGNQAGAAAAPQIAALAQSDIDGYRVSALFARATVEADSGRAPAAIATLRSISDNTANDQVYRDAALVRRTQLEFDALPPQEVIRRLGPLSQAGSAWLGSAGELVGAAHLKMNRPDLAGPVFVRIAQDPNVPEPLQVRARLMAGSLGFDVSPNPPRSTTPVRPAASATAPAAPTAAPAAAPAANTAAPATREKAR